MSHDYPAQFEMQKAQVLGGLGQLATSMRECAAYADQFAQMLSAMTWNGSAPAFAALPNGQYAMPVMPPMQMAHDDHGKKRKSRGDDSDGKRKHKKPRDPNAPKRPPSSYLIFQNDIRAELKAKNPGMRNNELLSAISKLWSEMPQDQKDEYEARNKVAKDEWMAQKKVYEAGKNGVPAAVPAAIADVAAAKVESPAAAPEVEAESSVEEDTGEDEEESSNSDSSDDDDEVPVAAPPAKKSKKESPVTPAKEGHAKKEKKHKKSKD